MSTFLLYKFHSKLLNQCNSSFHTPMSYKIQTREKTRASEPKIKSKMNIFFNKRCLWTAENGF